MVTSFVKLFLEKNSRLDDIEAECINVPDPSSSEEDM